MRVFGRKKKNAVEADAEEQKVQDSGLESKSQKKPKKGGFKKKNAGLATVVDESEPGAALDLLRHNTPFVVVPDEAWLVMLMPTSTIGGLSKKERRNQDKGAIINLIDSDDIQVIVTSELLEDDTLAFIPTKETLERMDEFTLLRKEARYLPAVIVSNPDSGLLYACTVPGVTSDIAKGYIFDHFVRVANGTADVSSIVDPLVVRGITAQFYSEDVIGEERLDVLNEIMESQNTCVRQVAADGGEYPTSLDFLHAMGIEDGDDDFDSDFAENDEFDDADFDDDDFIDDDDDGDFLSDAEEAALVGGAGVATAGVDDGVVDEDGAIDEAPVNTSSATQSTATAYTPPVQESVAVQNTQQIPAQQTYAPSAVSSGSVTVHLSDDQIAALLERQQQVVEDALSKRDKVYPHLVNPKDSGLPVSGDLSNDTVENTVLRVYENDSLGITVTLDDFDRLFNNQPPRINFSPYRAQTPWLNEQLQQLVGALNDQLRVQYEQNRAGLRDAYSTMINAGVADISHILDINNVDSAYHNLYLAIEHDQARAHEKQNRIITDRKKVIQDRYDADEEAYVQARIGSLREEFQRRNRAVRNNDLEKVDNVVKSEIETLRRTSMRKLKERQRKEAQVRYDAVVSSSLKEISAMHDAMMQQERESMNSAIREIRTYLENHATEDLRLSRINEEKLATDTRYENYVSETNTKIAQMQSQHTSDMARKQREFDEAKRQFDAQMAKSEAWWKEENEREKTRADRAEADVEAAKKRYDSKTVALREEFNDKIAAARDANAQKDYDVKVFMDNQKSMRTYSIGLNIILFIVTAIAFMITGAVFF